MDHVINVTLLVPVNADFDLELYGPYLKDYSKNGTGVEETISYTATASGNWSIRISRYVGEGPYNITLAVNYRLRLVLQASTYPLTASPSGWTTQNTLHIQTLQSTSRYS